MITTPMTDEQRGLAESCVMLAYQLAARAARLEPRLHDEIHSAAMMGLCDAARTFDPSAGVRFTTHASRRIRGEIGDAWREVGLKGYGRFCRPAKPPAVISLEVVSEPVPEPGTPWDDAEAFDDRVKGLPAKLKSVCREHYLGGKSFRSIARSEGISPACVYQRHRVALQLLRSH